MKYIYFQRIRLLKNKIAAELRFFKIYGDLNGESVLLETPNPPKLVGVPGFVVEKPGWSGIFLSIDFTLIRN